MTRIVPVACTRILNKINKNTYIMPTIKFNKNQQQSPRTIILCMFDF